MPNKTSLFARIKALLFAIGLSLMLGVTFLAPLIEQLKGINHLSILQYNLQDSAEKITRFFGDSLLNKMGSDQINIGLLMLALLVISLVAFRRLDGYSRYLLVMGIAFMLMATELFPWGPFQTFLGVIQFPWRFLAIANFLISLVGVQSLFLLLTNLKEGDKVPLAEGCVILVSLMSIFSFTTFANSGRGQVIQNTDYNHIASSDISTDYVSPDSLVAMPAVRTGSADVMNTKTNGKKDKTIKQLSRTKEPDTFVYKIRSARNRDIKLPNIAYIGYHVWVNNHQQMVRTDNTGVIHVQILRGTNSVKLRYVPTITQRISCIISLISWLGVLGYWVNARWGKIKINSFTSKSLIASK